MIIRKKLSDKDKKFLKNAMKKTETGHEDEDDLDLQELIRAYASEQTGSCSSCYLALLRALIKESGRL